MQKNKSSGQVSRLLLVLAVVVFVAVIITFLILKMAEKPPKPVNPGASALPTPAYEQTIGDIRFVFESAIDRGGVLSASSVTNSQYNNSYQKDLVIGNPGAKFIQVIIGAQNVGTENTDQGAWDIENIVDSKGRNFVPIEGYTVQAWLPNPNLCGSLLKPAFDPAPCVQIYEVSKESTGLKIRVQAVKGNNNSNKKDSALIDLIVK